MQSQQRVRHLLRRFGLGADPKTVRELEVLSLDQAIEILVDYEKTPDPYPVSPWEFAVNPQDGRLNMNGRTLADWWALKMCVTTRPMQEKLALFWHDHFAVGDDKVQNGRVMQQYLDVLRNNASGNFRTLLTEVCKSPAMVIYLDTRQNVRGRPNENFAREVMELFTLGVDNGYTEQDIAEAAKAFTGWNLRDTIDYRNRETNPVDDQIKSKVKAGEYTFQFAYDPRRHEPGPKSVFGKSGEFDGDAVIQLLLEHPETPRLICRKLWEYFAYAKPEDRIVDSLAKTFLKNDYEIKPVLREMAAMPEFWSEKAMRSKVKSPIDFTFAVARQFGAVAIMDKRPTGEIDPFSPAPGEIRQFARIVNLQARRQGLELLYPPSVEGWHWDDEWITSETMLYRIDVARQIFANRRVATPMIDWSVPEIAVAPSSSAVPECVDRLLGLLDLEVTPEQRFTLVRLARDLALNDSLYNDRTKVDRLWQFLKVVFAMPQSHVC